MPVALDLGLTEDQASLSDAVGRFLSDRGLPRRGYAEPGTDPLDGWHELAALGVVGALAPEADGGAGLGLADLLGVLVEMGSACFRGPFVSTAVGATSLLADVHGGDLLTEVAKGERVAVVVDGVEVRASGGRLTGTATLVPDTPVADVLLVAAADGARRDLYAVPVDAPGITVIPEATVDASRTFGTVTFADVAGELLAADAGEALTVTRDRMLAAYTADGLGAAATIFDLAKQHALTRVQFDVPVASFQAVQHALVDAYALLTAGRAGVAAALAAADRADHAQRRSAAVMAGAWCCDGFAEVAATAIQVLGGIGFTWEHDAQLYYKRLLSLQTAYGGTSAHLAELAALTL